MVVKNSPRDYKTIVVVIELRHKPEITIDNETLESLENALKEFLLKKLGNISVCSQSQSLRQKSDGCDYDVELFAKFEEPKQFQVVVYDYSSTGSMIEDVLTEYENECKIVNVYNTNKINGNIGIYSKDVNKITIKRYD